VNASFLTSDQTTEVSSSQLQPRSSSWMQVVSHIDPRYGGLSAFVPALTRRLTQPESLIESESGTYLNGCDVSLAAFCNSDERFKPEGVSARQLSFWSPSHSAWLRDSSLRRSFETQVRAADGLHIHGLWEISTSVAARTARRLGVPYILSAHGMLEPWALRAKRLKKLVYASLLERANISGASCLHALTHAEAGHYLRFGARSPIAIIPNAVEVPTYSDPAAFLDAFPALSGRRIVLFLGRIHPKKGLDLLLEAWAELSSTHPDAHLVLAGPDCEGTQAKLEETIAVRRLESSVTFTGMLGGTMKWSALAAAEAFVLPSHSEGLSVGVLEAMGMGLPVLVTEPCNMPEVLEHRAGWQVPVEIQSITAALQQLLANSPQANREIGSRGANLIASRFCWPVVARQFAALYDWVLDGTPMASAPSSIQLVLPENLL